MEDFINQVCIVGSGFMGTQIGLHCAVQGKKVTLVDISSENLIKSKEIQEKELELRISAGKISREEKEHILKRIQFFDTIDESISTNDLVIETVPENLELKKKIFSKLDQICSPHTILATNSSSINISQIENATSRLEKVVNLHFYPPVWQRPMVELMQGSKTSDDTMKKLNEFAIQVGMTPLIVKKESTGFIFNRVWRAIKKETLNLVDQGVASHEDVDRAWMIALGMPIGPFGLMDMVGLDVVLDVEFIYYNKSGDEKDVPPKLLVDKVEKGDLGQKTGKGFYSYPNPVFQGPSWLNKID